MKVLFVSDSPTTWMSGIWLHRMQIPSEALNKRGHAVKQMAIGNIVPEPMMQWPDTVIFGRVYATQYDPARLMRDYKKLGKRVLYDLDDDIWEVDEDNPSHLVSNALKDQYEAVMREADGFISPSKTLLKKMAKHFKKPTFFCPNGINDLYMERPHETDRLKIGYMGASSHWRDLQLVGDVLSKLSEKYDFLFTVYGIVGAPLEAEIYTYNKMLQMNLQPEKAPYYREAIKFYQQLQNVRMWHIPFMPPELHPKTLAMSDLDIGIAPLHDNPFNRAKSCIKFYEYAAVGTPVLASDVVPYSEECNYRAKNTFKDWYNKLEKLIVDEKFRHKLADEQHKWVMENRSIEAIGLNWEIAAQRPGGLKVKNQDEKYLK